MQPKQHAKPVGGARKAVKAAPKKPVGHGKARENLPRSRRKMPKLLVLQESPRKQLRGSLLVVARQGGSNGTQLSYFP